MIIRSYGTSTWTSKVAGSENSKYGPMYLHFNENWFKNFKDEYYYSPGQAFNYSVVTVNPKSKGNLNPFLSYVKLFFLSSKKIFHHAYLTSIVYIDLFGFLFLFLSRLLQSCRSFSKY